MDLVPRSKSLPVTPAGYRDQNAALARDLAPVSQITGKELSLKSIKGDFLGLEVDSTNLVAVCRFLRDQLGFDLLSCISGVDMLDHIRNGLSCSFSDTRTTAADKGAFGSRETRGR